MGRLARTKIVLRVLKRVDHIAGTLLEFHASPQAMGKPYMYNNDALLTFLKGQCDVVFN